MLDRAATLGSQLSALAQQLRPSLANRRIARRLESLALGFTALPAPLDSLWWQAGHPLYRLHGLPLAALSGPTQEIKAQAHALLQRLVVDDELNVTALDLRAIDGLCQRPPALPGDHRQLETLAALPASRSQVRIIGYRDFQAALYRTLPTLTADQPLALRQASWRGQRLFYENDVESTLAFASIVAYARIRGAAVSVPARVQRLRLNAVAVAQLLKTFNVFALPNALWNHPDFIQVLLSMRIAYARLPMHDAEQDLEWLLLPTEGSAARALASSLARLGAADVGAYLTELAAA